MDGWEDGWIDNGWMDEQQDFPGGSDSKASVYNAGDLGSIPGLGRFPGKGHSSTLAQKIPWTEEPGAGWMNGWQDG